MTKHIILTFFILIWIISVIGMYLIKDWRNGIKYRGLIGKLQRVYSKLTDDERFQ